MDEAHRFDIEVALRELSVAPSLSRPKAHTVLDYFELMEPFGGNFPYPVFRAEGVKVHRVRELRGGHLQMEISQAGSPAYSAIGFGLRKNKVLVGKNKPLSIVFEPTWNYYNDKKTIQLCVKAIE